MAAWLNTVSLVVTDPVQSPPDEQIRLVDATLQPACPPPGKNKINDNSVVKSFKDQLKAFLKTNLSKLEKFLCSQRATMHATPFIYLLASLRLS